MSAIRCAIYTRKSTEEGLDMQFNSLDAQREACEAYIASQRHEGWKALPRHYDDGGYSGGNTQRPALQALLTDIALGKVDLVLVYKIDRLTRSLTDFAKMVEVFDRHGVSFVSVTQQFNTTTSMGRLMLNVLLSFAQFEREVTGERIRDKIAASKRKGMWMGGPLPLGYKVVERKLIVVETEAALVRRIFDDFVTIGSTTTMARIYAAEGLLSKVGKPLTKQALYKLLHNRMYLGEINHKGQNYPGEHQAIITQAQWDAVHALIETDAPQRKRVARGEAEPLLSGLLFTADGEKLVPSYTNKKGKRYCYYTPALHLRIGAWASKHGSLPAEPIEALVTEQLVLALQAPHITQMVVDRMRVIRPDIDEPQVVLPMRNLAAMWPTVDPAEQRRLAQLLIVRVVLGDDGL